jgi:addiction module RelE/StbE family toxin
MHFSVKAEKQLLLIKRKNPKLFTKIHKQLKLFIKNPQHPSLRLHKLEGKLRSSWSISVGTDYRILFYYSDRKNGEVVVYILGTHKEVYK